MNKESKDLSSRISKELRDHLNNSKNSIIVDFTKKLRDQLDASPIQALNDYFYVAGYCLIPEHKFSKKHIKEILNIADEFYDALSTDIYSKIRDSLLMLYLNLKPFLADSSKDDFIANILLSTPSNSLILYLIDWDPRTLETLVMLSLDIDFLTQTLVSLVEDETPLRIKATISPLLDHPRACPLVAFLITFVAHYKTVTSLPQLPFRLKSDRNFITVLTKDIFLTLPYSSASAILLAQVTDQLAQSKPAKAESSAFCELIMDLIDKLSSVNEQKCYCNRVVSDNTFQCSMCKTSFHRSCVTDNSKSFTCLKCSLAPRDYAAFCKGVCEQQNYDLSIIAELKTELNISSLPGITPKSTARFIIDYLFSEAYNFNKFSALIHSHLLELIDEYTAIKLLVDSNPDLVSPYLFNYLNDENSNLGSLKKALDFLSEWSAEGDNADKIIGKLHDEFASKLINVVLFGKSTLKKSLINLIFSIFMNSQNKRIWNSILPPIAVLLLDSKVYHKLNIEYTDDVSIITTDFENDLITFKLANLFYYSHINPKSLLSQELLDSLFIRLIQHIISGNTKPITAFKNLTRWAPDTAAQYLDMLFTAINRILVEQTVTDFSHILLAIDIILNNVDELSVQSNIQSESIHLFEKIINEFATEKNLVKNSFSLMCKIGTRIGIAFKLDSNEFSLIQAFFDPVKFQKTITTYLPPTLGIYNLVLISSIHPTLLMNNKLQIIISDFLKENNSYFTLTTNILNDILMSPKNTTELRILTAISEIINMSDPSTNYSKFNSQLLYLLSRKFIIEIDEIVPKIISENFNNFWPENIGNLFIFFNTSQTEILGTLLANAINFLFANSKTPELKYLEFVFTLALSTRENKTEKTRLLTLFLKTLRYENLSENSLFRLQRMILAIPLVHFNLLKIKQTILDSVKKIMDENEDYDTIINMVDNFANSLDAKMWTK